MLILLMLAWLQAGPSTEVKLNWDSSRDASRQGTVSGELLELSDSEIAVRSAGNVMRVSIDDVAKVDFSQADIDDEAVTEAVTEAGGVYLVNLLDGARFRADAVRTTGNTTAFEVAGSLVSLPSNLISSVRVGELTDAEEEQWDRVSTAELSADVVVLRRPGEKLERIEGIVLAIDSASLSFDFSGQIIDIPFSKIAGFRTFTTQAVEVSRVNLVVIDKSGNYWPAKRVALSAPPASKGNRSLEIELVSGVRVAMPLTSLQTIDFAVGRSKLLSDLEGTYEADGGALVWNGNKALVASVLKPRPQLFRPDDSRVDLPVISFPAGGSAKYRLPSGYSLLRGDVALLQTGTTVVPSTISVWLNNQVVWQSRLASDATSAEFAIDVEPDQLLELRVSPEGGLPFGGAVQFINVRLCK